MTVDESGLAKSAAWAWYEHGSGSSERPVQEVDVWRSKTEPKPSRYKLEALRDLARDEDTNSSKNSLLDNYEIARISKQLDRYIEASHVKHHGGAPAAATNKVFLKKKILRGFWSRHVPPCASSRNDVVEDPRFIQRRQKLPEKGCVPVVRLVGCRARPRTIRA